MIVPFVWRSDASIESSFIGLVGLGGCDIGGNGVFVDAFVELLFLGDRSLKVLLESV